MKTLGRVLLKIPGHYTPRHDKTRPGWEPPAGTTHMAFSH